MANKIQMINLEGLRIDIYSIVGYHSCGEGVMIRLKNDSHIIHNVASEEVDRIIDMLDCAFGLH